MTIKTIGVIGAGTMGAGIAQVALLAGYNVMLVDLKEEFVERGESYINNGIKKLVEKKKISSEEATSTLERLSKHVNLTSLEQADMVIEVIIENIKIKQDLYREIDKICKPDVIFCSNTSGLSITEMASVTNRPDKVVGTHYFNPVPVMKLVEVIRGYDTSDDTYNTAKNVCESFGKTTITVQEAPAFAVNRILVPMINEAIFVLQDGVASAEDIDTGMMLGANHPIGPLALADLIGLDVLLMVVENLYAETGDSKYRPATLLRKLVRAGHFGRKTGRGIFKYN